MECAADAKPLVGEEPGGCSYGFERDRVDQFLAVVLGQCDSSVAGEIVHVCDGGLNPVLVDQAGIGVSDAFEHV